GSEESDAHESGLPTHLGVHPRTVVRVNRATTRAIATVGGIPATLRDEMGPTMSEQHRPWNPSDEPVALDPVTGALTLVDGTTFCLSGRSGDFNGGAHGLFFADVRALSTLQLR